MFTRLFSRALILTVAVNFVLHSDSAWAMEIKPHIDSALSMLNGTVLPEMEKLLSRYL